MLRETLCGISVYNYVRAGSYDHFCCRSDCNWSSSK